MMNKLKGYLMGLFLIVSSISMGGLGVWMLWRFYIAPFFITDFFVISADSWFFISFFFGISFGFCIVAPINVGFRLLKNRELKVKTVFTVCTCFGVLTIGMNILLYQKVIYPNNLIECPLKVGYKKNLLRDYVKDLSLCEK